MLGKLIKYEWKATARSFIPIYIAILLIALLNRGAHLIEVAALFNVSMFVMVGMFIALVAITIIVIIQRFHKNLFTDEGYLMFTLPVKATSIILSKLLISLFWGTLSIIVAIGAIFILAAEPYMFSEMLQGIRMVFDIGREYGVSFELIFLLGFVIILADVMNQLLIVYFSLSMPQYMRKIKNKIIVSIITFFGVQMVISFIEGTVVNSIVMKRFFEQIEFGVTVVNDKVWYNFLNQERVYLLLVGLAIWKILLLATFFFSTNYLLKNHLNLE
jgi:hypothetical protein